MDNNTPVNNYWGKNVWACSRCLCYHGNLRPSKCSRCGNQKMIENPNCYVIYDRFEIFNLDGLGGLRFSD